MLRDLIISTWEHTYIDIYERTDYNPTTSYIRIFSCHQDNLQLLLCENRLGAHLMHYISTRSTFLLPIKENHLGAFLVLRAIIISTWEHTYMDIYICKD